MFKCHVQIAPSYKLISRNLTYQEGKVCGPQLNNSSMKDQRRRKIMETELLACVVQNSGISYP